MTQGGGVSARPWLLCALVAAALALTACPDPSGSDAPLAGLTETHAKVAPSADSAESSQRREGQPAASGSGGLRVGGTVTLKATHPSGVPLHARPHEQRVSGRLPDGSRVVVAAIEAESGWLQIRHDGHLSWIVRRYLKDAPRSTATEASRARRPSASAQKVLALLPVESAARSRTACLARLKSHPPQSSTVRLLSLNVKWFPDGAPGKKPQPDGGTDIEWLACLIADSGAQAVALQEFKTLPRAMAESKQLMSALNRMTGGRWKVAFDDCPHQATQHVGIAYDAQRVRASSARTIASLNPHGEACKDSLRPGFALRLELSSGQQVDFVSSHLKSGPQRRSIDLRARSFAALAAVKARAEAPLIVAGDFNTMGCSKCSPAVSPVEERAKLAEAAIKAGLRLVETEPGCSHYYRGHATLLDGFIADPRLSKGATSFPLGSCSELRCRSAHAEQLPIAEVVTDHCPVVLQLSP